jgi:phosphatidylglycerol:prolipoprotein diacylglycerol transferase
MYPELIRIGNFVISSYGVMVAIAFLTAVILAEREWKRNELNIRDFNNIFIIVLVSAVVGSKLLFVFENYSIGEILRNPFGVLLSRGGFTYYGGFLGALFAVIIYIKVKKLDLWQVGDIVSPSLAIGYSLGRIGCFLVGDDYGRPTTSFLGIAFPEGSPPTYAGSLKENFGDVIKIPETIPDSALLKVWPTQIFETITMFIVFLVLWKLRKKMTGGKLFGLYLLLSGMERFLIEFLRMTTRSFIRPLSVAQIIAICIIIAGGIIFWKKLKEH